MKLTWIRKMNAQGQVTIPAPLRKQFGLTPGTKIVLSVQGGVIYLQSLKQWKKDHRKR